MKKLNVYVTFNGNCEEALIFYSKCLEGRIESIQRFKDAPMDIPRSYHSKIMYAEFHAAGLFFMASDPMPGQKVKQGDNVCLVLEFDDQQKQDKIFAELAEGGSVRMPLENTFWGSRFGMLKDKFGVEWMLNHSRKHK